MFAGLKLFWRRLKCKHRYFKYKEHFVEHGMGKMFYFRCSKCGKEKVKII